MLAYIASNGARTIIVETASRFARDLMVQEVGFAKLQALGIKLVAADSPHSFLDDTPTSKLIRQILGAVSEFDKAMVVAKLKGARERKRVITGKKVEGRKSHVELRPELVALVRQLRRRRPKGGQRSLREFSRACAARAFQRAWSAVLCGVYCLDARVRRLCSAHGPILEASRTVLFMMRPAAIACRGRCARRTLLRACWNKRRFRSAAPCRCGRTSPSKDRRT